MYLDWLRKHPRLESVVHLVGPVVVLFARRSDALLSISPRETVNDDSRDEALHLTIGAQFASLQSAVSTL